MNYYLVSVSFNVCIDDEAIRSKLPSELNDRMKGKGIFIIQADGYQLGNPHKENLCFFNSSVNNEVTKIEEVCQIVSGQWFGVQKIALLEKEDVNIPAA